MSSGARLLRNTQCSKRPRVSIGWIVGDSEKARFRFPNEMLIHLAFNILLVEVKVPDSGCMVGDSSITFFDRSAPPE